MACVLVVLLGLLACDDFFPSERSLDHIDVAPLNRFLKTAETQQMTATGVLGNGESSDLTSSATWTSSDTNIASVSASGLVTANAAGSTTITAASGSTTGSTLVNVFASTLQSIQITPNNPAIGVSATQQFTATGTFQDNSTQNISTLVTWSSSDTAIATISSSGLATAVATGTSTITATASNASGQVTGTVTLTVNSF
ncbi:MAG TPA: Ig-like domain-containing protein [Clostridia bacterium]|nr:Ig-like domain-containing protein [Clostridia bacterium]